MSDQAGDKNRILLVDDESQVLESLKVFFRDQGYQVNTAPDGAAALEQLQQSPHDLVVTDIRMPNMTGIELLRSIKEQYPHVEVILITGYGSEEIAAEARRLGAYDYIEKPFDALELLKTIFNCLERVKQKRKNEA